MSENNLQSEKQPFYFDRNIFDEDHVDEEEEEDLPPPPPTFSEEELEQAKKTAYQEGRAHALRESQESREQFIADLLSACEQKLSSLFDEETAREKIYEQEAVALSLAVMEKVFPVYFEQFGLEELKGALDQILEKNHGQNQIVIRVAAEDANGIDEHIKKIGLNDRLRVEGGEKIAKGDCTIKWSDGGAVRDSSGMAEEILQIMRRALAENGVNSHDDRDEDQVSEPPADVPEQTETPTQAEQEEPGENT